MSKPVFIIGNGLSIALSEDFSLKNITQKFINTMDEKNKKFLEQISQTVDREINAINFEENLATLEIALDNITRYCDFLESDIGKTFLEEYSLKDPELYKHEESIRRIYNAYVTCVLNIIYEKVNLSRIKKNIPGFVDFFVDKIKNSEKAYIFTLNYDLLVETILIGEIGKENFTDFCVPSNKYKDFDKFNFDPASNILLYKKSQKTELHHLHGSLSLFYNNDNDEIFKLRTHDFMREKFYDKIKLYNYNVMPAIITGGKKPEKVFSPPFNYYFGRFNEICANNDTTELYVIGYSFKDEHVNKLIVNWINSAKSSDEKRLYIIDSILKDENIDDYEGKINIYKEIVKSKLKIEIPDECFEFGGVEKISSCPGTSPKDLKKIGAQHECSCL